MSGPVATVPFDIPRSALGRLVRGGRRIVAAPDFAALAGEDWPDRVMREATATTLHAKQGRTISYWTLSDGRGRTLNLFLKRHFELPLWQGLLAALLPSRAFSPGMAEWEHLCWARDHGLPVARPVAAGEFRGPWGRLQSFLAVEELAGMLPLHEAIPLAQTTLKPVEFARWKRGLVAELARLARELHRRSTFHKDLYLCHFYLHRTDCETVPPSFVDRAVMIDFHRLARHRLGRLWFQVKDLAQLLFSTDGVPGLSSRDCLRFWKLYRDGDWGTASPPRRWVRGAVARKWKLYDRHNRKLQRERTP
jgi:Lipopolysaccharide kinase (Kdo/WaaP) family